MHEVLARLLAVADDVDAGIFLKLQRQQRRVVLRVASSSPSRRQGAQSRFGAASQAGFGRLPAMVVGNMILLLVFGDIAAPASVCLKDQKPSIIRQSCPR